MELNDFLNKHIIVTLKTGKTIEGILVDINDYEEKLDDIFYTTLNIRVDIDDYKVVSLIEIEKISIVE